MKTWIDRISDFAAAFYASATSSAERVATRLKAGELSTRIARHFSKPAGLLGIEAFVALTLSIYYFFLLLPMGHAPRHYDGDTLNIAYFTVHSHHPYTTEDFSKDLPDLKTRLPGQILTGLLTDAAFDLQQKRGKSQWAIGVWNYDIFSSFFAAYHSFWVAALFALLIRYRRDALLIMLGVFAGLMLNMTMPSWEFFFPWDLPSLFFFTWAFLIYDNSKRMLPLAIVVWIGALFKETTLCCALLMLLGEHWGWKKRIAGFVATVAAFALTKKVLLITYAVPVHFFSADNFFSILQLPYNFKVTFLTPGLNHVFFANAGTLLIMLLLPWRTYRDLLFKLVAIAFMTGIVLFGKVIEYRVWYEVLPLGWMLISETIARRQESTGEAASIFLSDRTRQVLKGCSWIAAIGWIVTIAAMLILSYSGPSLDVTGRELEASAPQDSAEAQKSIAAMNNLAWMLATSSSTNVRNGPLAVQLAERVCEQTRYQQTVAIGTLAAAYAEARRFSDAAAMAEKAIARATELGETNLVTLNQELKSIYQNGQAYFEPARSADEIFYRKRK